MFFVIVVVVVVAVVAVVIVVVSSQIRWKRENLRKRPASRGLTADTMDGTVAARGRHEKPWKTSNEERFALPLTFLTDSSKRENHGKRRASRGGRHGRFKGAALLPLENVERERVDGTVAPR